jgi:hypothetical protein
MEISHQPQCIGGPLDGHQATKIDNVLIVRHAAGVSPQNSKQVIVIHHKYVWDGADYIYSGWENQK